MTSGPSRKIPPAIDTNKRKYGFVTGFTLL